MMARASDLWLRLRRPQILSSASTASDVTIDLRESTTSDSCERSEYIQSPCDHAFTTRAGSNFHVNRKRCRICGELLEKSARK